MNRGDKVQRIRSIRDQIIGVCDSVMYEEMKEYDEICVLGGISTRINLLVKEIENEKVN